MCAAAKWRSLYLKVPYLRRSCQQFRKLPLPKICAFYVQLKTASQESCKWRINDASFEVGVAQHHQKFYIILSVLLSWDQQV